MISIRKIGVIRRGYRHLNRYRQIVGTLVKYGFGGLLDALRIEQYFEAGRRQILPGRPPREVERFTQPERIRMAIEELGPTFIKLGQLLSVRPDLIPARFAKELEKLQDHVPPFGFQEVKRIVEEELGQPLGAVFQTFEEQPLAAASIGQVHRARLADGHEVVVKIQRPGIRQVVEVDLEIMFHLASLMERHVEEMDAYRPTIIVSEFTRVLENEIDYAVEASYMERFAMAFEGDSSIRVPRLFRKASTERVLTTEFIPGIKVSEREKIDRAGLNRKEITARGADLILRQMFEFGFFHADPHPGNVLVLPENVICYLDYGMMGHLDRQTRENCVGILHALAKEDEAKTVRALLKLVEWDQPPDRRPLERDVADFMTKHIYRPLKEIHLGKLLQELLELLSQHHLRIPHNLFLMLKALAIWEGVGQALDPDLCVMARAEPFVRKVKMARFQPERLADDLLESAADFVRLAGEIPSELRDVLLQLRQGKAKIDIQQRGLESLMENQTRIGKKLAVAVLSGALIIGSALIVVSETPPLLFGIPILAVVGFAGAAVLAIWLILRA